MPKVDPARTAWPEAPEIGGNSPNVRNVTSSSRRSSLNACGANSGGSRLKRTPAGTAASKRAEAIRPSTILRIAQRRAPGARKGGHICFHVPTVIERQLSGHRERRSLAGEAEAASAREGALAGLDDDPVKVEHPRGKLRAAGELEQLGRQRRFVGIAWREDGIAGLEAEGVPSGALVPQRAGEGASSVAEVKR